MVRRGCYSMLQHLYGVAPGLPGLPQLPLAASCALCGGRILRYKQPRDPPRPGCMAGAARSGWTSVAGQVAGGNRSLPACLCPPPTPVFRPSLPPEVERNAAWMGAPPPTALTPTQHTPHSPPPTANGRQPTASLHTCDVAVAAAPLPLERAPTWTARKSCAAEMDACRRACRTPQTILSARCFVPGMLAHKAMEQSSPGSGSGSGSGSPEKSGPIAGMVMVRVRARVGLLHQTHTPRTPSSSLWHPNLARSPRVPNDAPTSRALSLQLTRWVQCSEANLRHNPSVLTTDGRPVRAGWLFSPNRPPDPFVTYHLPADP